MRAAAEHAWGEPTLAGRTVGVAGVGKVGRHLVRHLIEDGAERRRHRRPRRRRSRRSARSSRRSPWSPPPTELVASDARRLRPVRAGRRDHRRGASTCCAPRSSAARPTTSSRTPASRRRSRSAAILYAPDYCVNSGGLIQVADELEGFSFERAQQRATGIFETTRKVFELAAADGVTAGRSPPTGSPSVGCARSAACAGSGWPARPGASGALGATRRVRDAGGHDRVDATRRARHALTRRMPGRRRTRTRACFVRLTTRSPGSSVIRCVSQSRDDAGRRSPTTCRLFGIDLTGVVVLSSPCSSLASAPKSVS